MSYQYYRREPRLGYFGEPAQAPALQASLTGPASIQRGTRATYSVANAPVGASFSNWRFSGGGTTVQRAGSNNVADWQGTIVQAGTISVDMTVGTAVKTLSLGLSVTSRAWSENTPTIPLGRSGHGTLPTQPRLGLPGRDPRDPGLGVTDTREQHTIQTMIVNGGPNDGFNYLSAPPVTWVPRAFTNQALYDPSHPFNRAHDPKRRGLPLPGNRLQIGTIQQNVEAHEGIIAPPRQAPAGYGSHWQMLLNHLLRPANQINAPLEREVSHRSRETNAQYAARLSRLMAAKVQAATVASQPHPHDIFRGAMYFNYPYIHQRSLRLLVKGQSGKLALTNPAGGRAVWVSVNPAVAKVDSSGKVSPVAQGRTIIRVTNVDGDVDEIPVIVDA